jgi:hypothetical protein
MEISATKLEELVMRTQSLMGREFKTAHDAIPQVLNGAGLHGRTDSDRRKRAAYKRALERHFKDNQKAA